MRFSRLILSLFSAAALSVPMIVSGAQPLPLPEPAPRTPPPPAKPYVPEVITVDHSPFASANFLVSTSDSLSESDLVQKARDDAWKKGREGTDVVLEVCFSGVAQDTRQWRMLCVDWRKLTLVIGEKDGMTVSYERREGEYMVDALMLSVPDSTHVDNWKKLVASTYQVYYTALYAERARIARAELLNSLKELSRTVRPTIVYPGK